MPANVPANTARRTAVMLITCCLLVVCLPGSVSASPAGPFDDISGEEFYGQAARWLHHAGVFIGDGEGNLRPQEVFTRAHMAVVLSRMTGQGRLTEQLSSEHTAWTDDGQIPGWARGAFVLAEMRGWFIGRDDGTVGPGDPLTWAEISALLARVTDNEHLIAGQWPDSALTAAERMKLFSDIPHSPKPQLPILRGQMTVAVWAALRVPSQMGKDGEGDSLLRLHHGQTAEAYYEAEDEGGSVSVRVRIDRPHSGVRVQLQLGQMQHTAVTDSDGQASHTFEDVSFGRHRVTAEADGYGAGSSVATITEESTDTSVTVQIISQEEQEDEVFTVQEVAERALPATVTIFSDDVIGSGFHLGDGMVVTNYHVIDGQTSLTVRTHDGDEHRADEIFGRDVEKDVAIVHVPDLDIAALSWSEEEAAVGQKVVAVGSPWGLEGTVSDGIVSARRDDPELFGIPMLQTTAALSQGSSGGPLMNLSGEVVGVNTLQITTGEGLNFAVPAAQIQSLVDEALQPDTPVALTDLFDASLTVDELRIWLEELTDDTVFFASDVWMDDDREAVYFYLAVDFDGYGLLLEEWQQEGFFETEYAMYLLAEHIHSNVSKSVFGAINCLESWRSYPQYLSDEDWDIYQSEDGHWVSRQRLIQILLFGPRDYHIDWFGE